MEHPDVGSPRSAGSKPEPGLVEKLFNNPFVLVPLVIVLTGIFLAIAPVGR